MKQAGGTLLYRRNGEKLDVLLVHPSGNYNRLKPWSIPKGECEEDEEPLAAARRETWEETGLLAGVLVPLGHVDYSKSRKRVYCFAGAAAADANPHCASWEVDRCEFVPIEQARKVIHPDQAEFLERLLQKLAAESIDP